MLVSSREKWNIYVSTSTTLRNPELTLVSVRTRRGSTQPGQTPEPSKRAFSPLHLRPARLSIIYEFSWKKRTVSKSRNPIHTLPARIDLPSSRATTSQVLTRGDVRAVRYRVYLPMCLDCSCHHRVYGLRDRCLQVLVRVSETVSEAAEVSEVSERGARRSTTADATTRIQSCGES